MAGLGRRTHYRKHVTDAVLFDYPEPSESQSIAKVVATRGGNQFEISLPGHPDQSHLALLPTKFRKLVWVKRKDYVIVDLADDDGEDDDRGGIRYQIAHILYQDQIKHLKDKDLWPTDDPEFVEEADQEEEEDDVEEEDGIVYNDDDLMVNTNRIAKMKLQDSSSEEESEEDD